MTWFSIACCVLGGGSVGFALGIWQTTRRYRRMLREVTALRL